MAQAPLFRKEAIEHQAKRHASRAEVLNIGPASVEWGFRFACVVITVALAFVVLGRLNEYATGPALVRLDGRIPMTATHAALVTHVEVAPGDVVNPGDVLVRFYANAEAAELEAASREFDDQLLKLLQRPDDMVAKESLVSLRTRRDLAKSRLDQLTLRAPQRAIVGDVRVRPGQLVEPGMSALELVDTKAKGMVIALLPGRYRPMIKKGGKLRFELDGFQRRAHELKLSHVGDQIIGPAEAARYLGQDLAGAVAIAGPVVLVQAELPKNTFEVDGENFKFAQGTPGKAETVVRSEPIAYAFIPALKQWVERVWK